MASPPTPRRCVLDRRTYFCLTQTIFVSHRMHSKRRDVIPWRLHRLTQMCFRQKNIRTYFCLTPFFYISRRLRRNRRNSHAHFSCLTRNTQNSQTFTRSARSHPHLVFIRTRISRISRIKVRLNQPTHTVFFAYRIRIFTNITMRTEKPDGKRIT